MSDPAGWRASSVSRPLQAPRADRRAASQTHHADTRVDYYSWLESRSDPDVLQHLEAEAAYAAAVGEETTQLSEQIFQETLARIQETDVSAPQLHRGFWYYTRTEQGQQYAIRCRRPESMSGPEQVLLDPNLLAQPGAHFGLGVFAISPDQNVLAYATDQDGSELHELRFKDLRADRDLGDVVPGVYYGAAWSSDGTVLFYVRPDSAIRPFRVWRHRLGSRAAEDQLVYEEADERFHLDVGLTPSEEFVLIAARSETSSEWRYLAAGSPFSEPQLIERRREGMEYEVAHQGNRFVILTNDGAPEFRVLAAPQAAPGRTNWTPLVPERPGVRLASIDAHRDFLVIGCRAEGLTQIEICSNYGSLQRLAFGESAYSARILDTLDYEGDTIRFEFSSLTTPTSIFDYEVPSGRRKLLKRQLVPGYDPQRFVAERVFASAADGVRIPISLVRRRDLPPGAPLPTVLYGYGAYERSSDPEFRVERLALLERGFTYAIAHVRGGGEMGRQWYDGGRLTKKINTFSDFVACAQHLIGAGLTTSGQLGIRGASAGGLLVGAVLNMRPDLFGCAVLQVPFVDVLSTMLTTALPLTVTEYDEWGDPSDPEVYWYIKSYSPYDNIRPAAYPAILATAGLNDSRVRYSEPAKWVAKLRHLNTGSRPVVLRVNMQGGHFGQSGRYQRWREEAAINAFMVQQLGSSN